MYSRGHKNVTIISTILYMCYTCTVEDIKMLTFRIRRTIVLRLHSLKITVDIVF